MGDRVDDSGAPGEGAGPSRGGTTSGGGPGESTAAGRGRSTAGGRVDLAGRGSGPTGSGSRFLALLALLALATWLALAAAGRFPFPGWLYHFAWYTTLLGADAWLADREGRAPFFGRPRLALSLWLWSVPVWLLFELLNLRVANWYYVFASRDLVVRRAGGALAFATVLPAIYLGHRAVASLGWFANVRGPGFRVGRGVRAVLVVAGLLFLGLALWRPSLFFPLIWGATTLLIEPWNQRRAPGRSLLGDLARGDWTRALRLLAAGVAIGLLWETFNAFATTRWIYTVPGLEEGKLFEMPVLGYLGFPVFALDCFVIYQALVTLRVAAPGWEEGAPVGTEPAVVASGRVPASGGPRPGGGPERPPAAPRLPRLLAWAAAGLFSLAVLGGVDRYTVDSFEPRLAELPVLGDEAAHALEAAGYRDLRDLAASDPAALASAAGIGVPEARRVARAARLAALRGMGTTNAAALVATGIEDVCELADAPPGRVARAVRRVRDDPRAGHPARVRVWIRAARDACRAAAPRAG